MQRKLTVESKEINDNSECYVIAEIGHNHQGEVDKAKDMFRAAKECGADAVKLQKRDNRSLYTRELYDSPYDNEASYEATYGEHREALEFGRDEYLELRQYAKQLDLTMLATAFDFKSADFLSDIDISMFKVASGDLKNIPLLKYLAEMGKPMIVSTGGATLEDVQRAYNTIKPINQQFAVLQCTASYPVEAADMNLRVIESYREIFPDVVIGLSDHQSGISMALVGFVLGARIIEKHFTINRAWKGTDHSFSLEPTGMRKLVRDLHRAHVALGDGIKRPLACEEKPLYKMGKKLVVANNILKDHIITREDIAIKSPGDGLPPYELENVIGKRALRNLVSDEDIGFDCLSDQ